MKIKQITLHSIESIIFTMAIAWYVGRTIYSVIRGDGFGELNIW